MRITNRIVEAYLDCRYKAQLLLKGETGPPHDYEVLMSELDYEYAAGRDANADGCIDAIDDFEAVVRGLDIVDEDVIEGILESIRAAMASIERGRNDTAANQLVALINKVEAQRGKAISETDADMLIAFALNIIANLT